MAHDIFNLICWIWIGIGVITFIVLLKIPQPYGRHSNTNRGPMINNRHGWLIMELPALLVFVYFAQLTTNWLNLTLLTAFALWVWHYFNRAIIYPFRLKTKGKKMPVVIMGPTIFFNLVNGFFNGYWLARFVPEDKIDFNTDLRIFIGAVVFLAGFIINQYHDTLLINLRKGENTGYKIPYGGLFRFVSCPNFLGEIITWLGFFIVTLSLPALAFLIWTLANLVPRALGHHKWYRNEFADYPAKRKAVLPFLV
ncbi:MAG: 3-oxo-5-alpha-steroid [Prolixibacteraceae bacterium]|nr:MAG: 3-oxo-5-alpha-steroid [Prolixibacteraceae bacterium]